jgi:hypothetical protein
MQHSQAPGPIPDGRVPVICTGFPALSSALLVYLSSIFRRVRKTAKSDYELRHVCPHRTTRLQLDGFS